MFLRCAAVIRPVQLVLLLGLRSGLACSQTPPAATPPTQTGLSCPIRTAEPSSADVAYSQHKFTDALDLYRKAASATAGGSDRDRNGVIRSLIRSGKAPEAHAEALAWIAKSPGSSWAYASLDEVLLFEGALDQAVAAIQTAGHLDPCNMQVHLDFARFSEFNGMYETAKVHLDLAHKYEPTNLEINDAWLPLQSRAVQLENITFTLSENKSLSPDQRKYLERRKSNLASPERPCRLVTPISSATIPFHGIKDGPTSRVSWGLVVGFNGHDRRLEIDTGASGLTLTRTAAAALGLNPEDQMNIGGFGSQGATPAFRTKVASIKIGPLEFANCYVDVLEKDTVALQSQDGLIGGDVFRNFLLTLDFPGHELHLDPLPPRPGESAAALPTLATDEDDSPIAHDAYIAPSMQDWFAVFRQGHELLIPVHLNGKSTHFFMLDTGADSTLVSTEAAREVTKVSEGPEVGFYGLSGRVDKTYRTGNIEFDFAGLRYPARDVLAIEQHSLFPPQEVQVSGFLGAGILRRLTMRIDYRDNLVNFTYDPKRLTPCMNGVYREDCYN